MRTMFAVFVLAVAGPSMAQGQAQPDAVLRGPQVQEKPAPTSLVERDMAGRLKRLEVPPEEAALELLGMDEGTKAKTEAILAARAQIVDRVVTENLELVVKLHNAKESGDKAEKLRLLEELSKKLQPLHARGKLADELKGVLSAEKGSRLDLLVAEYRRAATEEDIADARQRGEQVSRLQANLRENLTALGAQIRRSYERTIAARAADFEQVLAQLSLRPEQETKIREMVRNYALDTKGKPSPEQRRSLFLRIMAVLDPDQQQALVNAYLGRPAPGM